MYAIDTDDSVADEPAVAGTGDHDLEAFVRREHPRLVGALSLYCGDAQVAEELAGDALVRAIDRWPRVRGMRAPGAWVHRVAMNLAKSRFRRVAAERRARERLASDDVPDPSTAEAVAVRQAVAALPDDQRRCVVLRFYLGYELAEAAEALDRSPSAVAALTYRALRRLRTALGDDRLVLDPETPDA